MTELLIAEMAKLSPESGEVEELSEEYRDFYARRVVCKVKDKCCSRKQDDRTFDSENGEVES